MLIACVDRLKGFPEAIDAIYSENGSPNLHGASDPQ